MPKAVGPPALRLHAHVAMFIFFIMRESEICSSLLGDAKVHRTEAIRRCPSPPLSRAEFEGEDVLSRPVSSGPHTLCTSVEDAGIGEIGLRQQLLHHEGRLIVHDLIAPAPCKRKSVTV